MTKWALTVLLVLTAPVALLGVMTMADVFGALTSGQSTEEYFSPNIPMNSVPLFFLPGWVAALAWTVRLFRSKAMPGKAHPALTALFVLILSVGIALIAFVVIVAVLWSKL
ncbi:hypothetical protein [Caulobacter sp. DWP3-1-3b2]|uniref:hypothetical protein n=1 Tax=Caulobacter sp. DWP3-1-3b2 TaxID=2804643 RepID=UPI003CED908E